jgi:hypothetical protein
MKLTYPTILTAILVAIGASVFLYVLNTKQENSSAAPQLPENNIADSETTTEKQNEVITLTLVDIQLCVFSDCEKYPAGLKRLVVTNENNLIYTQGKILASSDANSFEVLKTKSDKYTAFGRDKNNYYDLLSGTIITGATSENFVLDTDTTAYINGEFYNLVF